MVIITHRKLGIIALGASLAVPLAHARAQTTADSLPRIAFTNATLIDGTGAGPVAKQTILVSRGIIDDIFETGSLEIPAGTRVVNLAGKFVIPGLIDSQVHVATDPPGQDANAAATLKLALLGGLTSVRDMPGDAIALRELTLLSRRGDAELPR